MESLENVALQLNIPDENHPGGAGLDPNLEESFQLEEIEGHNRELIKNQLEKQLLAKIEKLEKEELLFERKLTENERMLFAIGQRDAKEVPQGKVKALEGKVEYYKSQIA